MSKNPKFYNHIFASCRKPPGGVGEPLQSYNNKYHRQHHLLAHAASHAAVAADDDIDVGKAGDEALDFESKINCLVYRNNKASDRSREVKLSTFIGNYDRQTDRPTEQQTNISARQI